MIYELVLRNFDCSLEFVFSLLLFQHFNFSPVSSAFNFQDWGCVILREIDFLLKICWSIPCLHPSWKVHTWIGVEYSLTYVSFTLSNVPYNVVHFMYENSWYCALWSKNYFDVHSHLHLMYTAIYILHLLYLSFDGGCWVIVDCYNESLYKRGWNPLF